MLPAGLKGPAFLATDNFSVIKLYNNSDVYAIFVGHVADMIASNAPVKFEGAWKPVERLPRDRIQRFQEVLVAQGHDVGKVDGLAGFKTRAAIGVTEKTARSSAHLLSKPARGRCGDEGSERRTAVIKAFRSSRFYP